MFLINIKPNKCDKAILENHRTLKPVADCYKNHEMCNNYPHALAFVVYVIRLKCVTKL